jgi:hypothetical protein
VNRFPAGHPYLARAVKDLASLIRDSGMMMTDTNTDGFADGWTNTVSTAGTASIVTDGSVKGKWQRISKTSAQAGTAQVFRDITLLGTSITAFTATASTDTLGKVAHGLTEGERVQFTGRRRSSTPACRPQSMGSSTCRASSRQEPRQSGSHSC